MNDGDYWDDLLGSAFAGAGHIDFAGDYLTATAREEEEADQVRLASAVESRISGRAHNEGQFTSVRGLTDRERERVALQLPVEAGTKVTFASNAGAVLTYDDPPSPGSVGTVVSVRSASGSITSHDGVVFVRWDDKVVRGIHAEHLRPARDGLRRVASLGDLTDFLKVSSDTLVHKATRDLWKVRKDGGDFVIERLFNDVGAPLKV